MVPTAFLAFVFSYYRVFYTSLLPLKATFRTTYVSQIKIISCRFLKSGLSVLPWLFRPRIIEGHMAARWLSWLSTGLPCGRS